MKKKLNLEVPPVPPSLPGRDPAWKDLSRLVNLLCHKDSLLHIGYRTKDDHEYLVNIQHTKNLERIEEKIKVKEFVVA